jgi:hypothetical protein
VTSLDDAVALADSLAAERGRRLAVYEVEPDADDPDAMTILEMRWRSWVEGGRPPREAPEPEQQAPEQDEKTSEQDEKTSAAL